MSELDRDKEDPKASITIVVAVIGALAVLVLIVALQAMFYNSEEAERETKVYARDPQELAQLRAQQLEQLNSYHWVDPSKGVVAIPIDRAMELTVRDQGVLPNMPAVPGSKSPASKSPASTTPAPGATTPNASTATKPASKTPAPAHPARKK